MTQASVEFRRKMLQLVERYPGLHLRELARLAQTSEALASYHLEGLLAAELVLDISDKGFRRFYPLRGKQINAPDRELMPILRKPAPLTIAVALLERGPLTHQQVVELIGMAKSTVSYHLGQLVEAGIVTQLPEGSYRLAQPRRVERFVLRYEPPRDILERFSRVWESFYGRGAD